MSKKIAFLWFLLFVVVSVSSVLGQGTTATITGVIKDATGAVLPGVTVTMTHLETGATRVVVSDEEGRYRASQLSLGNYEVEAELAGFKAEVRSGIKLTVGREAVVDFELQVGEVSEKITVTGEAPLVDYSGADISALTGEREMRDLPLNGRSFDQLIALESGAAYFRLESRGSVEGFGEKFTISGQRFESNKFYQDGTELLGASLLENLPGSAAGLNLGVDAIREFRLLTNNYSAEFGKKAGGAISTVTKSGTNELHGTVFLFHRNDNLDARNFFDPTADPPEFKRNSFGFSLGGPLRRDRMFLFGNYEGLRERLGLTNRAVVPDENARNGLLPDPATGRLVQRTIAPTVRPYLVLWPLPNGRNFGDGTAELFTAPSRPVGADYFTIRYDHNISNNDLFFASYTFDDADLTNPLPNPFFFETTRTRNQTATLEEKHIFSPQLLHVARFGFNRSFLFIDTSSTIQIDPALSFHPGLDFGVLEFGQGLTNIGGGQGPNWNANNFFQFHDQVSYSSGSHSLVFGAQIHRLQRNEQAVDFTRGRYRFFSLDEFLAGRPESFRGAVPPDFKGRLNVGVDIDANPVKAWRQTYGGFYAQDKWSVVRNLTLDLGLRYEIITVPEEANGRSAVFVLDRITPEARFLKTTPVVGPIFENDSGSFLPRIGLAWDPTGSGRTAIRAAFGIFAEQIDNVYRFFLQINPPFAPRADFSGGAVRFPRQFVGLDVNQIRVTGRTIDPNLDPATIFHYNVGVQRELFRDMVMKASYIGSHGYHLTQSPGVNIRPADILSDGRKFYPAGRALANPILAPVEMLMSNVNSFYNAFHVGLEKRFGAGPGLFTNLRAKWAYTLAKSIDDNSTNFNTQGGNQRDQLLDPLNVKMNRALSGFDVRHNFAFNFTYELPKPSSGGLSAFLLNDWTTNGILLANTGYPSTVQVGFNRSRNGEQAVSDRPDLAPGASSSPVLGGPDRYFDTSMFLLPEAGFYGNLGRNTLSAPGLATFDFSLVKNFPAGGESRKIQFRAEFFNLFNRANFGLPELALFDSSGRRVGSAGRIGKTVTTSRQIQLGLRYEF